MRLLATVLAVIVLVASSEAGSKCNWGPSYWCKSLATAQECGKQSYCQQSVWTVKEEEQKEEVKSPKGTIECDMCKMIVGRIEKLVENNSTEIEVKTEVEKVCVYFGPLAGQCRSILDEYFDEIWRAIFAEMDSQRLCELIDMCQSSSQTLVQKVSVKQNLCDLCKLVVNFIEPYVDSNSTKEEVKDALEQICKLLPGSYSSDCTKLVDDNFDMIWDMLEKEVDNDLICKQIGVCNSTLSTPVMVRKVQLKQPLCDLCKLAVNYIKPFIDSNSTEAEVKSGLESICKLLPGSASTDCTDFVEENFDKIWQMLKNDVDSGKVCEELGLCNSTLSTLAKVQKVGVRQTACQICELLVTFIKPFVDSNSTEEEAMKAVEQLCNILPDPYKTDCDKLIEDNFPTIWALVKSEFDNDLICKQIGVCNSTLSTPVMVQKVGVEQDLCSICKLIISFIEPFVDNNSTKEEVKAALDNFCALLPGSVGTDCKTLVDKNFDTIWLLIKSEFDNDLICKQIGVCNSTLSTPVMVQRVDAGSELCSDCELIVAFIQPFMDSNNVESDVKRSVEKVCGVLPSAAKNECTTMIDKYFDEIWNMLKNQTDSGKAVCVKLGLCTNTLSRPVMVKRVRVKEDKCAFCKQVVLFLKLFVDNNSTEDDVEAALQALCDILPTALSTQCTALLKNDFPQMWELLRERVDSGEICKKTGACNSTLSAPVMVQKVSVKQDFCDICKLVVSFIKPFVDANSTEAEVKGALEDLCKILNSDQCKKFVDDSFGLIWMLFKNDVDSGDICKQIGLCNSTLSTVTVKTVRVTGEGCELCDMIISFLDVFVNKNTTEQEVKDGLEKFCGLIKSSQCTTLVTEYFELVWQLLKGELNNDEFCKQTNLCPSTLFRSPPVKSEGACDICMLVVPFARKLFNSNEIETKALAELEDLCQYVPGTLQAECTQIVDDYFPMIWKLVQSYVDDKQICQEIGLCPKSVLTSKAPQASVQCVLCEFVLKEVDSILAGNTTEAAVKAALDKVCDNLPSTIKTECVSFVNEYADGIIKVIVDGLEPTAVCTAIGLCKSKDTSNKGGPLCVICEFVIKKLDSMIDSNSSKAVIQDALDKVCSVLPSTIKDDCTKFIDEYSSKILDLLDDVAPRVICTALQLCGLIEQPATSTLLKSPKTVSECEVCKFTLQTVKDLIDSGADKNAVEGALEKACTLLPKELVGECESFVKEYSSQIIQLVGQEIDPEKLCKDVGLCKDRKRATKVLMQPWLKMARRDL